MEVLGIALGLPSLVQTCIHGYRSLVTAVEASKDSAQLHAQLRLQEARLVQMALSWGLEVQADGDDDVTVTARRIPEMPRDKFLVDQASIFEEPVKAAMRQIAAVLADSQKLTARHGLADWSMEPRMSRSTLAKLKGSMQRVRWSLQDRAAFTNIVQSLTTFNDALERFVPINQRQTMSVGLAIQLATTSSVAELGELKNAAERYTALQQNIDLKSFCIKMDHISNAAGYASQPPKGIPSSLTPLNASGFASNEVRSLAKFRREDVFGPVDCEVLVEWKAYDDKSDETKRDMIRKRVEMLARLLHHAAEFSSNLRTLDCIRTFDDVFHSRIGLVLVVPESASSLHHQAATASCVTLYSLLGSDKAALEVPDLGSRISLAAFLARSLLQLHAAGWLHKGLRSDNVLFFYRTTGENSRPRAPPDISEPYIAGFDYSRPDANIAMTETLVSYHEYQDYYRHPASIAGFGTANPAPEQFRRTFDVYSLGCVLLEIGLWRRISEFWKPTYDPNKFASRLIHVYSCDLARQCGRRYEAVVKYCLGEPFSGSADQGSRADLQEFYQTVVCQLQSCVV